jgi:hypothetical protein
MSSVVLLCVGIFSLAYFGLHIIDDLINANNFFALLIAVATLMDFMYAGKRRRKWKKWKFINIIILKI